MISVQKEFSVVSELKRKTLKNNIDLFNSLLKILAEEDIHIRCHDDMDFAIDYIHYSPAQDEIIARFKEVKEVD